MTSITIEKNIKAISTLPYLQKEAERASDRYFATVENILIALVKKYGEHKDGVYTLPYEFNMTTTSIENDGMSGSGGSEWLWKLESITYYPEQKEVCLFCEGFDFSASDFEMECLHDLCHEIDVTEGEGTEDDDEEDESEEDEEE